MTKINFLFKLTLLVERNNKVPINVHFDTTTLPRCFLRCLDEKDLHLYLRESEIADCKLNSHFLTVFSTSNVGTLPTIAEQRRAVLPRRFGIFKTESCRAGAQIICCTRNESI